MATLSSVSTVLPLEVRMARLGGLSADTPIAVAGPAALDCVVGLCRLGFDHVICAIGHERCTCCADPVRAVLISASLSDAELAAILRDAARWLADEAVIVTRLTDIDQDARLQDALAAAGLEVCSAVFDLQDAPLVAHHVRRAAVQLARAA